MRLPFLEWAFNFHNNTVDIVVELIIILDQMEKNPESRHGMTEISSDSSVMGMN